ncbi:hypothetical protein PISMIDRAFT_16845 [Pisolithus microcarpus 441]|uniref:Reverse transcriptase domain-containing protein n=1 Tax=Pisolithus microcarpus 441 TaxID=765257 RepID=A0A0C9YEM5_9AGAM|nr:hypothetical protein PISMIDRAFT_16845 [Pisolithus microcarpus 441]
MPFGLTNAPAAFQCFVNSIFGDLLDVCVVVYLDNILVYSDDIKNHKKHVREVLCRLWEHSLYAKPEKCEFHSESVEYLGFFLSPDSLTMSEDKVKAIRDWPEPRKNAPWDFSKVCQTSFNRLKEAFSTAPILTHFQPGVPIMVKTDASDYTVAGILSITCPDGEICPVAFYSWTLTTPELNYNTHDKELLAIHEAFQTWRHYLEGPAFPVDVVTDHKNLEYFSTSKVLTRWQARWSEYLSQFNMIIHFCPGKLGAKPDSLTRRWDIYPKEGDKDFTQANPQNLRPVFTSEQLSNSLRATYLETPVLRASMIMDVEQLHADIKSALQSDTISKLHLSDCSNPRWQVDDDRLLRLDDRIYVLDINDLCLRVLQYKHDHPLAGHFGQNHTLKLIRRECTWPSIRTFIKDYVKSCTAYARAKTPRHRPYGMLKQLPVLERPWNSISMDFIEQLPNSGTHTAILVVVDRLSKQAIFIPTDDTITSPQLAQLFLLHIEAWSLCHISSNP